MKGNNGVQLNVHHKFWNILKEIQNERIKNGREKIGELSHKRLTLSLYKRLMQDRALYEWITHVEIDKNEI